MAAGADAHGVRCAACGAPNGYRRRSCQRCGESLSARALIHRLFAADPSSDDGLDTPRPPELASPGARLLAAGVDVTVIIVALFAVGAIGHDPAFGTGAPALRLAVRLLAVVVGVAHPILLEGVGGQTVGKRLVGIRVVDEQTRGPIGYRAAAHRTAARALFWFVSFLALTDPLSRTLHDRSAGTVVVKVDPPGPAPGPPGERIEFETTDDS
jgi:uncharacterized RDD family membrane protein YckC